MKVLVCGGRDYKDYGFVAQTLEHCHAGQTISLIITGGARGADRLAETWAKANHIPLSIYLADWQTLGKRAGIVRNIHMLDDSKPDLVIAFPGGKGTAHMKKISLESSILVVEPALPREQVVIGSSLE